MHHVQIIFGNIRIKHVNTIVLYSVCCIALCSGNPKHSRDDELDLRRLVHDRKCRCLSKRDTRGARCAGHANCFTPFCEPSQFAQLLHMRQHVACLHKLDMDRLVFDMVRALALSQGIICPHQETNICEGELAYHLLGKPVCRGAFASLLGIGSSRLHTMVVAMRKGKLAPPIDMRYITKPLSQQPTEARSEIHSYLQQLYDSVAETLPDCEDQLGKQDVRVNFKTDPSQRGIDPYAAAVDDEGCCFGSLFEASQGDADGNPTKRRKVTHHVLRQPHATCPVEGDQRWLPPGSMEDHWRVFNATSGIDVSFATFWRTWRQHFPHLCFRRSRQHACCATCVKYKLLIRELSINLEARQAQLQLYHAHLRRQFRDRQEYWSNRSKSRTSIDNTVTLIIDGMDQAKFAYPRSQEVKESKDFSNWVRPRLHVAGLICHGHFIDVTVGDADLPKDSSMTVEALAAAITRLHHQGVDLSSVNLHIQVDNTTRENKNNAVLRFLAALVGTRRLKSAHLQFLSAGHTHEDIDQLWGQLASHLAKTGVLQTPDDFVVEIQKWLGQVKRPHEARRFVSKVDKCRDWKSFLEHMDVHVTGIGGPAAPHEFVFQRFEGRDNIGCNVSIIPSSNKRTPPRSNT